MQRKAAHFFCDHRKAPAVLAGTSRLDGGIQGKDIGLEGDFLDGLGDLARFPGTLHGLTHDGGQPFGLLPALDGVSGHHLGQIGGTARGPGTFGHGTGELLDTGGNLLETRCLAAAAGREFLLACGKLLARAVDGRSRAAHSLDQRLQGGNGLVVDALHVPGRTADLPFIRHDPGLRQLVQQRTCIVDQGGGFIQQGIDRLHQILGTLAFLGFQADMEIALAHVVDQCLDLGLHGKLLGAVAPFHRGTQALAIQEDGVGHETEDAVSEGDLCSMLAGHVLDDGLGGRWVTMEAIVR